jgi:hypothetical protein
MRLKENLKDARCTALEKDFFYILLEIESHFRAEERKNLDSKRGRSHLKFLRIIKKPSENNPSHATDHLQHHGTQQL